MRATLGLCYDGKQEVCVCVCWRERDHERQRAGEGWQDRQGENAVDDCDLSALF